MRIEFKHQDLEDSYGEKLSIRCIAWLGLELSDRCFKQIEPY